METPSEIYFYSHTGKYGFMSNFYMSRFRDANGIQFVCSEQYFMYQKCKMFDPQNTTLLNKILTEMSPGKIKSYGRQVKNYDEQQWTNVRYAIMLNALRLKFSQNEDLKQKLLQTKPKLLYEASPTDRIWGIGFSAESAMANRRNWGSNLLGTALMQVRETLM